MNCFRKLQQNAKTAKELTDRLSYSAALAIGRARTLDIAKCPAIYKRSQVIAKGRIPASAIHIVIARFKED